MNKNLTAPLFYFGTLISSVGSLTFNVCLIAFMLKAGFNLGHASLIIGLQRLIPVIVTGIWGHFTDTLPARPTVFVAEVIAAISSFGLLVIWKGMDTSYAVLAALCIVRAIVVAFQTGSRSKITKLLSDDSYSANSKNAIWFNKATQGATLFSGLCAWLIIKNFNLEFAILFDAATFILNGLLIFFITIDEKDSKLEVAPNGTSWRKKFSDFFSYCSDAAYLDVALAVSMMGTVAFMSRMAGTDQSWTGKFMASYGLAVWIAGFLERKLSTKLPSSPFWIILGGGFFGLGLLAGPGWLSLGLFFIKDLSYWIILHRLSSYIQMDSPKNLMGSISSARMSIMISILACGEILVGAWAKVVPLWMEGSIRGFIAVGIGVYLLSRKSSKVVASDRPAL